MPWYTSARIYPSPSTFPCPLPPAPGCPAFPCPLCPPTMPPPLPCCPPCPSPAPCAPCPPCCFFLISPGCRLPPSPSVAPRCLPLSWPPSSARWPWCPAFTLSASPCRPSPPPGRSLFWVSPAASSARSRPALLDLCFLLLRPSTWLTAAPPCCPLVPSFALRFSPPCHHLQLVNDFWLRRGRPVDDRAGAPRAPAPHTALSADGPPSSLPPPSRLR